MYQKSGLHLVIESATKSPWQQPLRCFLIFFATYLAMWKPSSLFSSDSDAVLKYFFENWQIWNLGSPAKYFCKHTFSDIFPAFCAPFTALVAPLLIFYNNNDEKGKFSTKISYEEIWVFLKASANNITLGIFFSL